MDYIFLAVFAVLNPLIAVCLAGNSAKPDAKRFLRTFLFTAVPAGIIMLVAYCVKRADWTAYEFMCIYALVSVCVAQLAVPALRNKKLEHTDVLKALCFGTVIVALYSILTFGQTQIHSDTATATLLTQSQIANGSWFPASWNYANGDIWVITVNTFTFPFAALMENQSLARMLGSALYVLVAVVALVYHSRAGFGDDSWTLAVPLIFIFLSPVLGDMTLYQAAYTGGVIWVTICCFFAYKTLRCPGKKRYYIFLFFLLMLLCMGGIRALAEQVIPLLCGYVAVVYSEIREEAEVDWRKRIKEFLHVSLTILIPAVIGSAIYVYLSARVNVNYTGNSAVVFVNSLQTLWNNLVLTVLYLFECFGFVGGVSLVSVAGIRNMVGVIMCIIVMFIVPILQAKKINQEALYTRFFFWYGMMHNMIMLIVAVLMGKAENSWHLLTAVFVFIVISSRYIFTYWISQINFRKFVWTGLFVIATIVYCIPMLQNSVGWNEKLADQKQISQKLLDRGMTKGYASYWNAYKNEVYSDLQIRFGAISIGENTISPFKWLVDNQAFAPEDTDTFLLLTDEENQQIIENLENLIAQAVDYFVVNKMHVYIFDFDIAEEFSNGLEDGILRSHEMLYTENVVLTEKGMETPSNGAVFGPYTTIEQGEYTVVFEGSDLTNCTFDACSGRSPDAVSYEVISAADTEYTMQVVILEPVSDIEFRVFGHSDETPGCVYQIRVEKK